MLRYALGADRGLPSFRRARTAFTQSISSDNVAGMKRGQSMITGGCLCGAGRYATAAEPFTTRLCWCLLCQFIAAGNAAVSVCFPSAGLSVSGKRAISRVSLTAGIQCIGVFALFAGFTYSAKLRRVRTWSSSAPALWIIQVSLGRQPPSGPRKPRHGHASMRRFPVGRDSLRPSARPSSVLEH